MPARRLPSRKSLSPKKVIKAANHRTEHFKQVVCEGAEEFIASKLSVSADGHPKQIMENLITGAARYSKMTERTHLECVALAYALYVFDESQFGRQLAVELEKEIGIGRRTRRNYDPVRFFLEVLISYSGTSNCEANRAAGQLYARDARAIRHLMMRGVPPSELLALAGKRGEGLDAWARAKVTGSAPDAAPEISEKNSDVYEIKLLKNGKEIGCDDPSTPSFYQGVIKSAVAYAELTRRQLPRSPTPTTAQLKIG